jgi:hypothetical protein
VLASILYAINFAMNTEPFKISFIETMVRAVTIKVAVLRAYNMMVLKSMTQTDNSARLTPLFVCRLGPL